MTTTKSTTKFWLTCALVSVLLFVFQVIFAATHDVVLTWSASTDNVGVTGYKILRSTTNGGPYTQIATTAATTYTDSSVSYSSTYYYVVQAYDAANNTSGNSNQATAVVPAQPDTTPPTLSNGQPSGVLSVGTTQTTISVSTNEAATCRYGTADVVYAQLPNQFTTTGSTSHSSSITGLQNAQTYHYYVRCSDQSGNVNTGSYSIQFSVAADTTPPILSSVTAGSISQTSAIITWTTNEAADSEVGYGTSISYAQSQTSAQAVTSHTVPLSGLTPGTVYHYHVRSTDVSANTSGWSSDQTFTTDAPSPQPNLCGNGTIDAGEECDGSNLNNTSCTTLGFSAGIVSCSASCAFVTAQCTVAQQCTEQWTCSDWSTCSAGSQTRTCTDVNSCGSTANRPTLAKSCTTPSSGGGGGGGGSYTPPSSSGGVSGGASGGTNGGSSGGSSPTTPSTPTDPTIAQRIKDVVARENARVAALNLSLRNRLLGWILLQTQEKGEAWYLEPLSKFRYYLANGDEAYKMLSRFGLGVTDKDLSQIPIGISTCFQGTDTDLDGIPDKMEEGLGTDSAKADTDGDGFSDKDEILGGYNPLGPGKLTSSSSLISRLKGRILLQVQKNGQAWYLNPKDGKRYYTQNGEAAYQIMRCLSLGVTNTDLNSLQTGE